VALAILLVGATIWYRAESPTYDSPLAQDDCQKEISIYGIEMLSFGVMFVLLSWLNLSQHPTLLLLPFAAAFLGTSILSFYKRKLLLSTSERFWIFPVLLWVSCLCFSSLFFRQHSGAEIIAPVICVFLVIAAMASENFFQQFGDEETRNSTKVKESMRRKKSILRTFFFLI
jgi:hypothetical protein